jgi:hypothetical protein
MAERELAQIAMGEADIHMINEFTQYDPLRDNLKKVQRQRLPKEINEHNS